MFSSKKGDSLSSNCNKPFSDIYWVFNFMITLYARWKFSRKEVKHKTQN